MSHPLFEVFSQAHFRAEFAGGNLPESFGIVTAWNPSGDDLPELENIELNRRLQKRLTELELIHFPVTGGSPDFVHAEPGFGILCDLETARELGREFNQIAVFHITEGIIYLVYCSPDAEIFKVAPWSERIV